MNIEDQFKLLTLEEFEPPEKKKKKKKERPASRVFRSTLKESYRNPKGILSKHMASCQEVVGDLEHGMRMHVVTFGSWSMEHLIAKALDQIGPMHFQAVTWSIGYNCITKLCQALRNGEILSCRMVFDYLMRTWKEDAYQYLRAHVDELNVKLYLSHAKTYLLWNDEYHFVVNGSANLTNNPRIECMTIDEDKDLFEFHYAWMDELFECANPFDIHEDVKKLRKK